LLGGSVRPVIDVDDLGRKRQPQREEKARYDGRMGQGFAHFRAARASAFGGTRAA
jgi:hypothetical protein